MPTTPQPTKSSRFARALSTSIGLLVLALVVMWAIEIVDTIVLDDRLQRNGIVPRTKRGIDGIAWAPFLHSDWGHIASNSVPLLALGGLVAARGRRYWLTVTLVGIVVGGVMTWLLAGRGNHIGASGVIFAYFGAILGAAIFERRIRSLGAALLVLGFYSSMLVGIVPQDFISWEGHLFGMVAGAIAAWGLAEPREERRDDPDKVQAWEVDEPWRQ